MIILPRLFLGFLLFTLAACSAGGPRPQSSSPAMVQQISNAQELGDVVSLLDNGDSKAATKKLRAMIKRDSGDARAAQLLESLRNDPKTVLGERSFDYQVVAGDTVQSLAQQYLGDRLKFYLLARYNDIAVPKDLKVGQTLRIPGEVRAAPQLAPKIKPSQPSSAATLAPKALPEPSRAPIINPKRAAELRMAGLAALNNAQIAEAVSQLERALGLDPANVIIQRDLARAKRLQDTVRKRR